MYQIYYQMRTVIVSPKKKMNGLIFKTYLHEMFVFLRVDPRLH